MQWKLLASIVIIRLLIVPCAGADAIRISEGRELFMNPCSRCHPMTDLEQGKIAPRIKSVDVFAFAAAVWNQSPNMLKAFESKGWTPPAIDPLEMKQIFLFTQVMADQVPSGDPQMGRKFVEANHCLRCHAIGNIGGNTAMAWDHFANILHPTTLMSAVWSHRRQMLYAFGQAGLPRPSFKKGDLADLIAFMREYGKAQGMTPILVDLERITVDPTDFDKFHCNQCHKPEEFVGHPERSLQNITEALLSHAFMPAFDRPPLDRLTMTPEDSLSLAGLVYYFGHMGRLPSPAKGKAVFRQHECIECHNEPDEPGQGAITINPIHDEWDLISRIFNKVPSMIQKASVESRAFPRLTPEEMANLYAYLCSSSPDCKSHGKDPVIP
jgi:cytochrome c2